MCVHVCVCVFERSCVHVCVFVSVRVSKMHRDTMLITVMEGLTKVCVFVCKCVCECVVCLKHDCSAFSCLESVSPSSHVAIAPPLPIKPVSSA